MKDSRGISYMNCMDVESNRKVFLHYLTNLNPTVRYIFRSRWQQVANRRRAVVPLYPRAADLKCACQQKVVGVVLLYICISILNNSSNDSLFIRVASLASKGTIIRRDICTTRQQRHSWTGQPAVCPS